MREETARRVKSHSPAVAKACARETDRGIAVELSRANGRALIRQIVTLQRYQKVAPAIAERRSERRLSECRGVA